MYTTCLILLYLSSSIFIRCLKNLDRKKSCVVCSPFSNLLVEANYPFNLVQISQIYLGNKLVLFNVETVLINRHSFSLLFCHGLSFDSAQEG